MERLWTKAVLRMWEQRAVLSDRALLPEKL